MKIEFMKSVSFSTIAFAMLSVTLAPALAQDESTIETAKPADTVSPYGVSYLTGSYTYDLPVLSIGHGDWPNKIEFVLKYDSSGNRLPNKSWTHSLVFRMSELPLSEARDENDDLIPEGSTYQYNVVMGNASANFTKTDADRTVGNFSSVTLDGNKLEFSGQPLNGGDPQYQTGIFKFTSRNGSTVSGSLPLYDHISASGYTLPDGTKFDWIGVGPGTFPHKMLVSNRGVAVVIENSVTSGLTSTVRVCAYNLTVTAQSSIQDCSLSTNVATLLYDRLENVSDTIGRQQITRITRPDGKQYNFEYVRIRGVTHGSIGNAWTISSPKTRYHLSCIKEPNQSQCIVSNTYQECDGPKYISGQMVDPGWKGSRDRVVQQNFADGRQVNYNYSPIEEPCREINMATMTEGSTNTVANFSGPYGNLKMDDSTDRLNRTTNYNWTGANSSAYNKARRNDLISSITLPEGNKGEYFYDDRGNVIEKRLVAKPGSGQSSIVTTAAYATSCSNFKTCNKPTSITDPNGNTTNFTYSSDHGGVLTSVGTPVDGVAPAKKYSYVQRHAWVKQTSGYTQASSPVWLLSEERSCKTSALNFLTDTCSAGSSDLIVTSYDYGPNSGPNNLWLRGTVISADGQSLRTCYRYDQFGRKISETQPNANLTSCPV